jgi:hypothetical protein
MPASGGDGLPTWSRHFELHTQLVGNGLRHINVESGQLIVIVNEAERWIVIDQHILQNPGLLHAIECLASRHQGRHRQGKQRGHCDHSC